MNKLFLTPKVSGMNNLFELMLLKTEKKLAVIFISNHLNYNDPFVETAFFPNFLKEEIFPITFLATHEKFGGSIKSFLMMMLGCIPVGNEKGRNVRETLKRIKEGETIYLFPEGKVSLNGKMSEDIGALQFFGKFSNVIIQPIRIKGLEPYWDLKNMFLRKRKLIIAFGKPFILEKGENIDAVKIISSIEI